MFKMLLDNFCEDLIKYRSYCHRELIALLEQALPEHVWCALAVPTHERPSQALLM